MSKLVNNKTWCISHPEMKLREENSIVKKLKLNFKKIKLKNIEVKIWWEDFHHTHSSSSTPSCRSWGRGSSS